MSPHDELIHLEHAAWKALSTSGDAAAEFYDEVLAKDVLMLLPGGMTIDDRATVVDSMHQADWTSFELADERVLDLTHASAVVAYQATAQRDRRRLHRPLQQHLRPRGRCLEAGAAPADAGLTDRHPLTPGTAGRGRPARSGNRRRTRR